MFTIIELYNAVNDKVRPDENGSISLTSFNIKNKAAGLNLLDYITGDVEGVKPPEPYLTQKNRDWLAWLIKKYPAQVSNGVMQRPADFYRFESLKVIGSYLDENDCGEVAIVHNADTPIDLLDSQAFDQRQITHIKSLRPSANKPIAKMTEDGFEFAPKDLGSVKLEYVHMPVFGEIKVKHDPVYNEDVPDDANSINPSWPDFAFNLLVWFISRAYGVGNRERSLQEQLQVEGKSVRG